MKPVKYISLHNTLVADPAHQLATNWTFVHPVRPASYDADIQGNMPDATRHKREANRAELIKFFEILDAYETHTKVALEAAYNAACWTALRDDVLDFLHVTVTAMLEHLEGQCLVLTQREHRAKLQEITLPWSKGEDIKTYFVKLDKLEEKFLLEYGIEWPTSQKIMQAVNKMYDSSLFDAKEMMAWENKPAAEQTWVNLQMYFGDLWDQQQCHGGGATIAAGFGDSAAAAVKTPAENPIKESLMAVAEAATADKQHIQQLTDAADDLLAVVKQQSEQINTLITQNGELTAALASKGEAAPKPTPPAKPNAPTQARGRGGRPICAICGGIHVTKKCFELECNKANQPATWKTKFPPDE